MSHHHYSRHGRGKKHLHHRNTSPEHLGLSCLFTGLRRRFYNYGVSNPHTDSHGNRRRGNEREKLEHVREPDPVKVLIVKRMDLKVTANGKAHRTSEYDISAPHQLSPKLVVRRGQPFDIDLDFSKIYDPEIDDLRIVFEIGANPIESKNTRAEFILSAADKPKEWGAKIQSSNGTVMTVTIFTPPKCIVGAWNMKIDVVKREDMDETIYRYIHEDPIYIIFNPWCKDDDVYMEDETLLKEYVLNESGRIFCGNKHQISYKPWNFGQFESIVLDVALYLLDVSYLSIAVRGNPIAVVRKISNMVNSSLGGVLVGKWTGNYTEGRSPLSWTGSVAILEQYWETRTPVKFGQCWVYSGVVTSILRALGIPVRCVTNFCSAHDYDGSITMDDILSASGELLNDRSDKIWNFHVWNEVWMARPDLPIGYGGWQAMDATPQELSDGVYCCGPVSVQAIKQGEVSLPFDAPFVFAEVNADRISWQPNHLGKLQIVGVNTNHVGKFISTMDPKSKQREDLTINYKPVEGSAEERACVLKARQSGLRCKSDIKYREHCNDIAFTMVQDSSNTWVGEPFTFSLCMKNKGNKQRTVNGRVVVKTMFYTGVTVDTLVSEAFADVVLMPGQEGAKTVTVKPEEYGTKLKDCCMLDVSAWATVKETQQIFTAKEDFRLRKPHLTVKAPREVYKGQEFKIEVSFKNPLDAPLTNGIIEVDGLARSKRFPQGNVTAKGTLVATLPVIAQKVGQKELILAFNSAQLEDINASWDVFVRGV